MAARTDTDNFDDTEQLSGWMRDMRAEDPVTLSSTNDAKAVVDDSTGHARDTPWTSLDRGQVNDCLVDIIEDPRVLKQGGLNLCGPAALINMWTGRDPVGFANFAVDLLDNRSSSLGALSIAPSDELLTQDFRKAANRTRTV